MAGDCSVEVHAIVEGVKHEKMYDALVKAVEAGLDVNEIKEFVDYFEEAPSEAYKNSCKYGKAVDLKTISHNSTFREDIAGYEGFINVKDLPEGTVKVRIRQVYS